MTEEAGTSIPPNGYVKCPVVYLDHNVFARFLDERDAIQEPFGSLIVTLREAGHIVVPFSTTHVLEVARINGAKRDRHIQRHLKVIDNVTGGTFIDFHEGAGRYTVQARSPFETFTTMMEVPHVIDKMKDLLNLLPASGIEQARKDLGLDPVKLNNLSPREAEALINQALAAKHADVLASPEARSVYLVQLGNLDSLSVESIIDLMPALSSQMGTPNAHVRALMKSTIMELFGFCPDKLSKDRLTAHFDSAHEAIAQAVSYFITEERRLLRKMGGRKSDPTESGNRVMTRAEFINHYLELTTKVTREHGE